MTSEKKPTRSHIAKIFAGLPSATNDPATFEDESGYWVQGDCVFFSVATPEEAIAKYREQLAKAWIGISHNLGCDAIKHIQLRRDVEDARNDR